MAKGTRHLRTLFKTQSKSRSKDQKYLEGDWKLTIAGLQIDNTSIGEAVERYSVTSFSTFSTNATMDNNIGPGRMLDKLYQYLGRKVEWGILRTSISSLHPNKILNCLLEEGHEHRIGGTLKEIVEQIRLRKGSVAIAGLKSLVHQTQ